MSIKVMTMVFETPLPPTDKLVALCLADHAHDDGTHVYPAVASLAEKASLGTTATRSALRRLEGLGILVQEASGGGRGKPARYRFDLSLLGNPTESVAFTKPNAQEKPNGFDPQTQRLATETQRLATETQRIPVGESLEPSEPSGIEPSARPRNIIWDAMAEIYGQPTDTARTARGVAVSTLQKAGAEPDDLIEMFERFAGTEAAWAVVTPTAMAKYFGQRQALDAQAHKRVPDRGAEIVRQAYEEGQRAGA